MTPLCVGRDGDVLVTVSGPIGRHRTWRVFLADSGAWFIAGTFAYCIATLTTMAEFQPHRPHH